jgi:hypothetical protein
MAIITVFFIAIGSFFIYAAALQYHKRKVLINSGMPADAVVIRLEQDNDPDSSSWYPVIQFTTLDRKTVTVRHNFGTQPASYYVGQQVQILYDPLVPTEFMIGVNAMDWVAFGFGFIGAALIISGLYERFKSHV